MVTPLLLRLNAFSELSEGDRASVANVDHYRVRHVAARRDVISEGDGPRVVNVVMDGWGCRYKQLPNGRRQLLSFLLPGDLCDANVFILRTMDHSVGAITLLMIAEIGAAEFTQLYLENARISRALWWNELVTVAIQREWTTSIGQRTARERIAHLFCELYFRLDTIGHCTKSACEFPITQNDIADATGLTSVHVNRMLQDLRADDLIRLDSRRLTVPDIPALARAAMFNPNYLHLDQERRFRGRDG